MGAKDDAFVTIPVKCPICSKDSRQRYVKSKLYTPQEVESDKHVVTYKWENPQFEGIRPNFFHIWHCPHCHFCDEKEVFRKQDDCGGKLELLVEKLLIAQRAPDSVINLIGGCVDFSVDMVTLNSVLAAHLLAIHIQEMLSPNMRQYPKLARFYLRTAWLFREKNKWTPPETNLPQGIATMDDFIIACREDWPGIPADEKTCMEKAISYYQETLDRTKQLDDVRHEITIMFLMADMSERLGKVDDSLKYIRHLFQQCTQKRQATRHTLDGGISRGKLSEKQIESMRSLLNWLNIAIERATQHSEKLNKRIFEMEYPVARQKIMTLKNPSIKGILEFLREEKFHEVTCRKVAAMFKQKMAEKQQGQKKQDSADAGDDQAQADQKKGGLWGKLMGRIKGEDEE